MTIWVNQKKHQVEASLTLQALLQQLGKSEKTGIAIALNNSVIPKANWPNTKLNDQDRITIITATQGG